jgi:serine/threonine protein kinase/WD40 repeat protein/tetratricopeptide (TPR) repeat protein
MTAGVPNSAAHSAANPAFDILVDGLIAQLQAGEAVNWSAIDRDYPEHARRLRSMAAALEALGDLSGGDDSVFSCPAAKAGQEDLVPGVLGDFRILREVGRGGMGVVYEAEQVSLDRRVALKVLPFAATMDPRQLQRFRHEARAAAMLHHPHIVPVYGVGCERGTHYYAMQLIDGCSLAQVIANFRMQIGEPPKDPRIDPEVAGAPPETALTAPFAPEVARESEIGNRKSAMAATRPLAATGTVANPQTQKSFRQVAELIAQAADALEYAHTMGVVHRDVKPANLLLDAGGNIWVTDFGLARLGEGPGLTLSGDLLGTLRYMSPEQALARHGLVDHRTDVYSLGVTLYELLTLRPVVEGASKQEVLHRLGYEEPIAPRRLNRSIPAELETVTLKALAKNPQERYATAQEFADDLRRWLADRPIQARPPGMFQRFRKWSHRHRPLVAVLAIFLILFGAGLSLVAVLYGFSKGELAGEWSRFAEEKEQKERKIAAELRQVLVARAEAIRVARLPGYRGRVWADLRQAIALQETHGSDEQIRTTVLACLGDPVGLDPVEDPTTLRRVIAAVFPAGFDQSIRKAANGGPTAVSPDRNLVAIAKPSGAVTVYDRDGKSLWHKMSPLGGVYALALAADGTILVAGCEQGFVAWDLPGPDRWIIRAGNITSVAISPNRRLLAIGGRQLELWSLATKRVLTTFPTRSAGSRVEFSADGRVLLAVTNGTPIAGWPVSDTPERQVLDGHDKGVPAIVFSPDGKRLASVSKDRTVRIWDAAAGRPLQTLKGHTGEIEAVAISPDGSLLATGDFAGMVRLWDIKAGSLLTEVGPCGPPGQVWQLRFSSGGEYLAAAGGGGAVAWAVESAPCHLALKPLWTFPTSANQSGVIDLAIRPGGSELVFLTRGGSLYAYDLTRAEGPHRLGTNARVTLRSLHFTPDGKRLTFVNRDGALVLWDWQERAASDIHCPAESVALSANGRWAAAAGKDRSVTVVDLESGRGTLALPPEAADVWCLAWAPDESKLAVGLSDGAVVLWDLGQVSDRLKEFGCVAPLTTQAQEPARPIQTLPNFEQVIKVNRLQAEAKEADRQGAAARAAGDRAAEREHRLVALNRYERLVDAVPDSRVHCYLLANTHQFLAGLEESTAALRHLEAEGRLRQHLITDDPTTRAHSRGLAISLTHRSKILDKLGRLTEARDDARRANSLREKLAADPGTPDDRLQLAIANHNLGFQLARAGELTEAKQWYRAALAAEDRLTADFPALAQTPKCRASRGATLHNLGVLLARAGETSAAEKVLRDAATVRTQLADDVPANADYASELGRTLEWQGGVLRDLGKLDESVRVFREAVRRQEAALAIRPNDPIFRELRSNHQANLAKTLLRQGRNADEVRRIDEAQIRDK